MCFNIGVIIGPILGGVLADPVNSYPHIFGPGSWLGGKDGVQWMQHWPYALPNVLSGVYIFISWMALFLGLEEVGYSGLYTIQYVNIKARLTILHDTEVIGGGSLGKN